MSLCESDCDCECECDCDCECVDLCAAAVVVEGTNTATRCIPHAIRSSMKY